jgi:hypothetical protein
MGCHEQCGVFDEQLFVCKNLEIKTLHSFIFYYSKTLTKQK